VKKYWGVEVHLHAFLISALDGGEWSASMMMMMTIVITVNIRWVPCHHGMAPSQVVDGGEGLQTWRLAANMLNKHSRTANKWWSFSLWVGRGAKKLHRKNLAFHEMPKSASDMGRFFG
jgi:hypothetical protein